MQRTDLTLAREAAAVARASAVLQRLRYFSELAADLITRLVRRGTLVRLDAGDVLIREGDTKAAEMYVLIDGVLSVESRGQRILRLDRPGEIVGELAVLQAPPRTADVVAETSALLLAIRPEIVALPEFADLAAVFYMMASHSLANKLRDTTAHSREQIDVAVRAAATDALTGLANRKRLDETLRDLESAAERGGPVFALIMADVDHFKHYNDSNGHVLGDVVLKKVAALLQSQVRHGDLAARYGGEEFAVVLPDCDLHAAARVAEKLRGAIEREEFQQGERQPMGRITATFGVASYAVGAGIALMVQQADARLYAGKAAGRNVVVSSD